MNISEVMQLRQRIDAEIAAMNRTKREFAVVARHEVITHHFNILGVCFEQLAAQVGEEAAVRMLIEQMEQEVNDGGQR